jgi:hypothetical protein
MTGLEGKPAADFLRKVFILICCDLFNIVTLNSNICSSVIVLFQHY